MDNSRSVIVCVNGDQDCFCYFGCNSVSCRCRPCIQTSCLCHGLFLFSCIAVDVMELLAVTDRTVEGVGLFWPTCRHAAVDGSVFLFRLHIVYEL